MYFVSLMEAYRGSVSPYYYNKPEKEGSFKAEGKTKPSFAELLAKYQKEGAAKKKGRPCGATSNSSHTSNVQSSSVVKDASAVPNVRVKESTQESECLPPKWCPSGLSHTQKRRLQRLRQQELIEQQKEVTVPVKEARATKQLFVALRRRAFKVIPRVHAIDIEAVIYLGKQV
ncbi:hypothetical protein U9M48_008225 [Paspalum notatum var. saurae]|uniref:Uncharacterized protein n=1 Tax=Paspalum notatum var. saurae TaxID=547442 RepID=A0AAQ3SPC8_PASNO